MKSNHTQFDKNHPEAPKDTNGNPMRPPKDGKHPEPPKDANGHPMRPPKDGGPKPQEV